MMLPRLGSALLLLTIGCGDGLTRTAEQSGLVASEAEIRTAAGFITQAKALSWLSVITDDSMGGRNTPSQGLEKTAQFLANQYGSWGLLPAGENNSWFQRYPLAKTTATAPNVVAMVRGSDPLLRDEYVVFSAHMDHLGTVGDGVGGCNPFTRTNGTVDNICNGADDDGSGTVAVLAIAEAVTKLSGQTRRSLVVLNVSGEEKGLLGSTYYTSHPTLPLGNVVADINLDMISRNNPDSIVAIGKQYSDLGVTLARVVAGHPELQLIAADDLWPTQNLWARSDHYSFARNGVPALLFYAGSHPQYHRANDEVGLVDAGKLVRVAQLAFYLGIEVANTTARPQMYPASLQAPVVEPGVVK
jgi:hypothetical protein